MPEAKVRAGCVQAALRRAGARPKPQSQKRKDPSSDERVAVLADRASYSPRTIYRVLDYPPDYLMDVYSADRLLIAAGANLAHECDGEVVE